ncbi:Uncharacterized conserved protein, DUF58 family, contains vWF domain [Evansella caseinilytica]|uniref:Uncharacterized conserved protein, DUF58 family, contains vWF domain n=1 Tax=Evansella caseinilytica TaxID=1503961 RepID=A0A1H3TNK2_9BACI|nr:DUF58 domain-containing protein [Evansella caseinilytica]SDZ51690.1 Uncharacterized conserved protein, DUF58 family, contains vWF domain [Evansella caseinilytica]
MKLQKLLWKRFMQVVRGVFIGGVFIGFFSYAMFQGGFVSWFLFYSSTILVILLLLYAAIPLGSFHVTREMGEDARVSGSELTVTVVIRRKFPFPFLYLHVNDHFDEHLKKQMAANTWKTIFYPSFKRELEFTYTAPQIRRGEYFWYGIELRTSDMFGLFDKYKFVPLEETILVYPNYHEIERWSAYEKNDTETRLSSFDYIEDFTSVAGAREYVPGDKLTSIDWKITARSAKLMTKEFEEYIGENLFIVLNNHLPDADHDTLEAHEQGIELVTSIVMYAHRRRLKVGLNTLGNGTHSFPLESGADHQKRLVHHLAKIHGEPGGSFSARLKGIEDRFPQNTTVIIVSTEVTDDMLKRVQLYLSRRMKIYFCLMDRDGKTDKWEERRFAELRKMGAEVYLLSGGNIDHAIPAYAGD